MTNNVESTETNKCAPSNKCTSPNQYTAFNVQQLCLRQIHYRDIAQQLLQVLVDIPDKLELNDLSAFIDKLQSLFVENRRRRVAKEVPEADNSSVLDLAISEYGKLSYSIIKRGYLPYAVYSTTLELVELNEQQNKQEGVSDNLMPMSGAEFR